MKFLLVIFAIAAMAQFSMAGPVIRYKRSADFLRLFERAFRSLNSFAPRTETLVKNIMQDMPRTHDYSKYFELFEGYLKDAEAHKTAAGSCLKKSYARLEMIREMVGKLLALINIDPSPAAAEVTRLLTVHNSSQLAEDIKIFDKIVEEVDLIQGIEELTDSEVLRLRPLMYGDC